MKLISGTGAKNVARDSMEQQSLKSTMNKCTVSSIIYDMAIVSFKQAQLFQDEKGERQHGQIHLYSWHKIYNYNSSLC